MEVSNATHNPITSSLCSRRYEFTCSVSPYVRSPPLVDASQPSKPGGVFDDVRPTVVFDDQTLRSRPRTSLARAILACCAAFFPPMTGTISSHIHHGHGPGYQVTIAGACPINFSCLEIATSGVNTWGHLPEAINALSSHRLCRFLAPTHVPVTVRPILGFGAVI